MFLSAQIHVFGNIIGFPGSSNGKKKKKKVCLQCRRPRFDPWIRKIHGERNGNPLQYSCPKNPIDRGAWWATVYGVAKSQIRLNN